MRLSSLTLLAIASLPLVACGGGGLPNSGSGAFGSPSSPSPTGGSTPVGIVISPQALQQQWFDMGVSVMFDGNAWGRSISMAYQLEPWERRWADGILLLEVRAQVILSNGSVQSSAASFKDWYRADRGTLYSSWRRTDDYQLGVFREEVSSPFWYQAPPARAAIGQSGVISRADWGGGIYEGGYYRRQAQSWSIQTANGHAHYCQDTADENGWGELSYPSSICLVIGEDGRLRPVGYAQFWERGQLIRLNSTSGRFLRGGM